MLEHKSVFSHQTPPKNCVFLRPQKKSIAGVNFTSPKFKIGEILDYHADYEGHHIHEKVAILGYALEISNDIPYHAKHRGQWRYYIYHLDSDLFDDVFVYEHELS